MGRKLVIFIGFLCILFLSGCDKTESVDYILNENEAGLGNNWLRTFRVPLMEKQE